MSTKLRTNDIGSIPKVAFHRIKMTDIRVLGGKDVGLPGGMSASTTARFWNSLAGLIGQPKTIFNLFSHEEVFERVSSKYRDRNTGLGGFADLKVVVAVENDRRVLGVTNEGKFRAGSATMTNLLNPLIDQQTIKGFSYLDGVITMYKEGRGGPMDIIGNGDIHNPESIYTIPMDGYGQVKSYIGLLRQICSNGMVAMGKAFGATVTISKNTSVSSLVENFIDGVVDEDSVLMLKRRLIEAADVPASFYMVKQVINLIGKSRIDEDILARIHRSLAAIVEPAMRNSGIASLSEISEEKQLRLIPTLISVYQLMNLCTEIASHYAPSAAPQLYGLIGEWLSQGSYDHHGVSMGVDFDNLKDFYIDIDVKESTIKDDVKTLDQALAVVTEGAGHDDDEDEDDEDDEDDDGMNS